MGDAPARWPLLAGRVRGEDGQGRSHRPPGGVSLDGPGRGRKQDGRGGPPGLPGSAFALSRQVLLLVGVRTQWAVSRSRRLSGSAAPEKPGWR